MDILDQTVINELKKYQTDKKHFIVVRGHQGAGKSTFSKAIIDNLLENKGLHGCLLERDDYFVDENGNYNWSAKGLKAAEEYLQKRIDAHLKNKTDVIVVANTTPMIDEILRHKKKATKNGYLFHVFRMQNLFENVHNVSFDTVKQVAIKMQPYRNEFVVPPSNSPLNKIEKLAMPNRDNLSFDESKNTYLTKEYMDSFENILFTKKKSSTYPHLFVLKYKREVFFENKWDNALLETRGTVLNENNEIVIRPFKKVFNYSELGTNDKIQCRIPSDNDKVYGVVKINGFLGNATYLPKENQVIYSTTGSLDSDFVVMTKNHLQKYEDIFKQFPNKTFAFEIVDKDDPHIIKEQEGAHFIGLIDVKTGYQSKEKELDVLAENFGLIRPKTTDVMTFKQMALELKNVKHEGFMVFDANNDQLLCKMKSPYYLVSKFIARNINNIEEKLSKGKQIFDEEYYPLVDYINENKEKFIQLDEQKRIEFVQEFIQKYGNGYLYESEKKPKSKNKP